MAVCCNCYNAVLQEWGTVLVTVVLDWMEEYSQGVGREEER